MPKNGCGPKRILEEVRNALAEAALAEAASAPLVPVAPVWAPAPVAAPEVVQPAIRAGPSRSPVSISDPHKADFNHVVLEKMPQRIAEVRQHVQNLASSEPGTRLPCLLELHRVIHGLAGATAFTSFRHASQFSAALETLLQELQSRPQKFNFSALRTITQAIELLEPLVKRKPNALDEIIPPPLILVLNDDSGSREAICTALDQAHLRAISLGDPVMALKLLEENHFGQIFVDVQMPEMSGFELCQHIHALPANPNTPVVFITDAPEFEARMLSASGPAIDFVAKPILTTEIAVKALTCILRARCGLAS
jgi:CheY-like chemotaxis protein